MTIRGALQAAVDAISPSLPTAWPNTKFDPPAAAAGEPTPPYQRVDILLAEPANEEISPPAPYTERGILQVNLCYPLNGGPEPAEARAQLIRAAFYRGRSIPASPVTITIDRTAQIAPPFVDGDRWVQPVSVRFSAQVRP